jgi:hypothetical protein
VQGAAFWASDYSFRWDCFADKWAWEAVFVQRHGVETMPKFDANQTAQEARPGTLLSNWPLFRIRGGSAEMDQLQGPASRPEHGARPLLKGAHMAICANSS